MLVIESVQTVYSCPLKDNRPVDDCSGQRPSSRGDALQGSEQEGAPGKRIKVQGLPQDHKVRLVRGEGSTP
jgi:hypothetical protein